MASRQSLHPGRAPSSPPWNFPSHDVVRSGDIGSLSGFRSRPITSGVLLDNLLLLSRPQGPPLHRDRIWGLQCRCEDDRSQFREHVTLPAQGKDLARTRAPGGAQQLLFLHHKGHCLQGDRRPSTVTELILVSPRSTSSQVHQGSCGPWWPWSCL